jgi:hypothetical protein
MFAVSSSLLEGIIGRLGDSRLSVAIIDVHPGRERDFLALAASSEESSQAVLPTPTIPDEGRRFMPRQWTSVRRSLDSYRDRR